MIDWAYVSGYLVGAWFFMVAVGAFCGWLAGKLGASPPASFLVSVAGVTLIFAAITTTAPPGSRIMAAIGGLFAVIYLAIRANTAKGEP